MKDKFSFFSAPIRNVMPNGVMDIRVVYEYVTSDVARERTMMLRGIVERKMQQQYKATKLDYVTPSALVARRGSGGLIAHSGWVVIDIDHVANEVELQRVKNALIDDAVLPPTMIFRSPSGDGLKVWYAVPAHMLVGKDEVWVTNSHKAWYEAIASRLYALHGIECDYTSDVMRACYLCWDEDAYFDDSLRSCQELIVNRQQSIFAISESRKDLLIMPSGAKILSEAKNSQQTTVINDEWRPSIFCENLNPNGDCRPSNDWDTVEALVRGIEQACVDITGNYHQWMRIGFALASAFGESGRGFYHRVSRFYSGYSNVECNRQYDRCLRARGSGVGLGTFIYLAKTA